MVGEDYRGSYDRVTTIITRYEPATISGMEDLIVKLLASAKSWNTPTDIEQAFLMAKAHEDNIDWNYIEDESRRGDIGDCLAKLKEMLAKSSK